MHEHFYTKKAKKSGIELADDFQTPSAVADYGASLLTPGITRWVFEPTPGRGNLVAALQRKGFNVVTPHEGDYFKHKWPIIKYDAVFMNPPFSDRFLIGDIPPDWTGGGKNAGMKVGYRMLFECMEMTDEVVAIVPWFLLTDSDKRARFLKAYGLVSLTHLPRKTFNYARIQCVVLHLKRGFTGTTEYRLLTL